MNEKVNWSEEECPYSPRFDDVYRSRSGAVLQAQSVFVGGCHLPQVWQQAKSFCILETGFGLGLNFLVSWLTWQADPGRCSRLHFVSVEAYPVTAADLIRSARVAGDAQSALEPLALQLADAWGALKPGVQHFGFDGGTVQLTLAIGQVQPMLQQLDCVADAVYLDGFSPAKNPEMWSADTLSAVAGLCRPGTRLASYAVASKVRRALAQAGFAVKRYPGVPPKWQRLEAVFGVVSSGTGTPGQPSLPGSQQGMRLPTSWSSSS